MGWYGVGGNKPSGLVVLKFQCAQESPGVLIKYRFLAPLLDADIIGVDGVKSLILLSSKFVDVSDINVLWHVLCEKWPWPVPRYECVDDPWLCVGPQNETCYGLVTDAP